MSRRVERLNEQLKREISDILRFEVKDPRIGMVTVTGARASTDLSLAQIFVSIPGDDAERTETLEGLSAASPYIRSELGKRMKIRKVPELRFRSDESLDYAMRIEKLLGEVLPPAPPTEASGDNSRSDED